VWTPSIASVAAAVGPVLVAHGIRLAGLDVIGDVVVEVNVFSTGGLFDAERFSGADFSGRIVDAIADAGPRSVATALSARDAGSRA
jgi:glutathione synthase